MSTAKNRLSKMRFDFVSLVPAGDDPLAQVVISKADPTHQPQEDDMGDLISKDDLDPTVVAYIEGLEGENETLAKAVEDAEAENAELQSQIEKMVPAESTPEDIEKAALAKADPAVVALIQKQEQRLAEAEAIAKAERDTRLDREFISKAEQMPMLTEDPASFGPVLRRIAENLSAEDAAAVDTVLKAANAQIAAGNLFSTVGVTGATTTVAKAAEAKAAEIKKADPTLTDEQALAKAYETDPGLLAEAMTNTEG